MALQTKTFQSEKTSNQYYLRLTLTEESVNVTENTSKISYTLTLFSGAWNYILYATGHEIKLGGTIVSSAYRPNAPQYSIEKNSSVVIASGSATVTHDSDGGKEMSVAFSISVYPESYTPGDISVTGKSMTLTQIARASTIGATDANIGATSILVVNRKSSAYRHSVQYSFGSLSGYITEDGGVSAQEVKLSATNVSWTVPTAFYAQIPNAKSGVCTLTCKTYSGTTQIGDAQTATLTVTASQAACAPTVTGSVTDVNDTTVALTGNSAKLVRFYSTARCTISATAKNSASITAKTVGGVSLEGNIRDISAVETGSVVFSATDSRGYAGSATVTKTLVPYIKLTNNASCERMDPTSGKATLKVKGEYFNGSFGAVSNALTVKYKIGYSGDEVALTPTISGNTYTVSAELEGLTYTSSHTVIVTVSDKLASVENRLSVKRGIPVFDWGESDFSFNVPVTVESLPVAQIVESGKSGIWRYRKWSNGDAECWGEYTGKHAITNNYNGVYYSNTITVQYPFAFASPAILTVSGGSNSQMNWARKFALNNTTSGSFCVVANVQMDSVDVFVNLHAFGKWK